MIVKNLWRMVVHVYKHSISAAVAKDHVANGALQGDLSLKNSNQD